MYLVFFTFEYIQGYEGGHGAGRVHVHVVDMTSSLGQGGECPPLLRPLCQPPSDQRSLGDEQGRGFLTTTFAIYDSGS